MIDFLHLIASDWNLPLFLALAGAVSGLVAGLFGIGGGVVIVPVLYYFSATIGIMPAYEMQIIMATSLAVMVFSAGASALSHIRYGEVSKKLLIRFAPVMFIGALFGTYLNSVAKSDALTVIFAVFCLLIAFKMALGLKEKPLFKTLPSRWITGTAGFFIASFSAMIGVGGGTLSVPTLTFFNAPIKTALGTSSVLTAVVALSASISYMVSGLSVNDLPAGQLGYVNWIVWIFMVPVGMLFAPLGSKISNRLSPKILSRLFALLLVLSSGKMLLNVFG